MSRYIITLTKMVKYTCKRCGHIFKQNQHLQNHMNRKNQCIELDDKIMNMVESQVQSKIKQAIADGTCISIDKKSIHEKGQYFTTNLFLKESVYNLILNPSSVILEPSIGQGDLVEYISSRKKDVRFDSYEIDETIPLLESVHIHKEDVQYGDFLSIKVETTYDTIVGNPPYVKTKGGNLYLDFIEKCYQLLNPGGELIFIVPSDFIKLTSSSKIINTMMENGTFTHIIHPHDEKMFAQASIDVIIFRYCKDSSLERRILVNDVCKYLVNTNGILTFSDNEHQKNNMVAFSDYFDIYVGMVTGKEGVFKNDLYGNIELLNGQDSTDGKTIIDKYILLDTFPSPNDDMNDYMLSHKSELISRKIRKFSEKNWFEWGALRNRETIKTKLGRNCIYVSNITRAKNICFHDTVQYFGGGLIIMIPKEETIVNVNTTSNTNTKINTKINLEKMTQYMNSDSFKSNYMYSGRFKIGHKQLCNCLFEPSDFV